MTVSTATDMPVTVRSICISALRKAGVAAIDIVPQNDEIEIARDAFRAMLRTWAAEGVRLWAEESISVPLFAGTAEYAFEPRILGLERAYVVQGNPAYRTQIRVVTREEFERLPNPSSPGTPYWCWLDRQRTSSTLSVYPVPSTAGLALSCTVRRLLFDITSINDDPDVPPEWEEALIYNLGARLCDDSGRGGEIAARVASRAGDLYAAMKGQDREESTTLRAARRRR